MIKLLQDTKLSVAGINYTVPKGLYIDTDEGEVIKDNGLAFVPVENDCTIEVCTVKCYENDNIRDTFMTLFEDGSGLTLKGEPTESFLSELYTIRAQYESKNEEYFEINFDKIEGYDERIVFLITAVKTDADMGEILQREVVREIIESFEQAM